MQEAHNPKLKTVKKLIVNHPYIASYLLGCLYFGLVMSWMFTVRTSQIAQGRAAYAVGISAAAITVSSFALGFVVFTFIFRRLKLRLDSNSSLILVPAAWVASEYLRSVIFSIISLGPTGKIGAYWSYGDIGYILGLTPLTYLGRLGGVYFLSFITALLIVLIIRIYRTKDYYYVLTILLFLIAINVICWKIYDNANGKQIVVSTLSYKSVEYPSVQSNEATKLIDRLETTSPDTVVLPEYSGFFAKDSMKNDKLLQNYMQNSGVVIQSRREIYESYNKNMLVFLNPSGKLMNEQQKWFTIPSGEYVPYVYQVLLAYAGKGQLLLDFRNQKSVLPGSTPEIPFTYEGVTYGSLVCSGITSPIQYRKLAFQGATILTNSASLGSLGVSSFHHTQAQIMARQYAINTARPFVQSAKDAPAFIYDHNGILLGKSSQGIVQAKVLTNKKKTPYVILGNWIVMCSALLIIARLVSLLIFKPKNNIINHK